MDAKTDNKCPFTGTRGHSNRDWWPDALSIEMLIGIPICPIRWEGISTTPRSSKLSTSTP